MRIVTVDAETYYDMKTYSLAKMPSVLYVRDERFEEIGWAGRVDQDEEVATRWVAATDYRRMHEFLKSLRMDEPDTITVTQNGGGFDFLILCEKHGIVPWMLADTLVMARQVYGIHGPTGKGNSLKYLASGLGLGEKGTEVIEANGKRLADFTMPELMRYGDYCINDVDLTYGVFRILAEHFTSDELCAMSLVMKMTAHSRIEVDYELCRQALQEEMERQRDRLSELSEHFGVEQKQMRAALMSNPKFAALLSELGVEPPLKISKTTGRETFAFAKTDEGMQELMEHEDEDVADLARLRMGIKSTIVATRLQSFIDIGLSGAMPAGLRYGGAHTGRCSADGGIHKCQLQNLPSRGKEGKRNALRLSLRAPDGYIMVGADSSQIEVRVSATLANETVLMEAFDNGEDPYLGLGPTLFGRPITKADKSMRDVTKAAVLAAGFKQGAKGFLAHCKRSGVEIDEELSERTIAAYRGLHLGIGNFWKECKRAINTMANGGVYYFGTNECLRAEQDTIVLPSGRKLVYNECQSKENTETGFTEFFYQEKYKKSWKYIYDGRLTENIVQAVAYDVLMWQALQIEDELGDVPVLFTHDELVYLAPEAEREHYREVIERWMRTCPPWLPPVALDCEYGEGYTYADV